MERFRFKIYVHTLSDKIHPDSRVAMHPPPCERPRNPSLLSQVKLHQWAKTRFSHTCPAMRPGVTGPVPGGPVLQGQCHAARCYRASAMRPGVTGSVPGGPVLQGQCHAARCYRASARRPGVTVPGGPVLQGQAARCYRASAMRPGVTVPCGPVLQCQAARCYRVSSRAGWWPSITGSVAGYPVLQGRWPGVTGPVPQLAGELSVCCGWVRSVAPIFGRRVV